MTQPPTTEELLASLNRALPCDQETEHAILSCLLQRPSLCDEAPHAEMFYHHANRIILASIIGLFAAGKPVDQISLTHALRNANKLDIVGGPAFISELFTLVPTTSHYQYYLTIVRDKFQLRQMIGALASGIAHLQAFQEADGASATDALQHVTKLVCEAVNDDGASEIEFKPINELMLDVVDAIEERVANPGKLPGVSTGFAKLDEYTGGLEKGTLTVIAGKPSDGKSIVARQICENVCMEGHAASIFSVEMTPLQEGSRILCSQAGIDAQSMKLGILTRGELDAVGSKIARISKWDMQVFDAASCSIEQICRNISRRAKKLKPHQKLIAEIDYIQICKTSAADIGNREQEVSHIAKTAKICAKMTGAAIIFPCQLNKQGEARESEAIEQHADNFWVIMDHEDEDAPKKKAWEKTEKKDTSEADFVDLFLKKVRNGIRRVKVPFRRMGRFFRFEPHTHEKRD